MNKYWIVGTSSIEYIKRFIKFLKIGISSGEKFIFDYVDKNQPKFIYKDEAAYYANSFIVARQTIDVWTALGFIKKMSNGYLILVDFNNEKKLCNYSKLYILTPSEIEIVSKFRYSKMIDMLVEAGIFNQLDIKNLNINQTRGQLTIEKIKKNISKYEKFLIKDKDFIREIKERIKNG